MKLLLWKEWRQNWLVLMLGLALVILFPIIYAVHPRHLGVAAQDVVVLQYGVALLYALLMGSTLVAPEVASGTIGELFARPVNPWKVWLSKLLFGLMTTAVVFFVAMLAGALAVAPVLNTSVFSVLSQASGDSSVYMAAVLLLPALVLAISMFTSTLTEQPILAMVGTVIVMAALAAYGAAWTVLLSVFGGLREDARVLISSLAALIAFALFLALSGLLFARGQIYTGVRRPKWRLAGVSVGCVAVLAVIALFCGFADVFRLAPHEDYEVVTLSPSPDGTKMAIVANAPDSWAVFALWIQDLQTGKRLFQDIHTMPTYHGYYTGLKDAWSPDSKRYATFTHPRRSRLTLRLARYYYTTCLQLLDMDDETASVLKRSKPGEDDLGPRLAWSDAGDTVYCFVRGGEGGMRRRIEHVAPDGTVAKRIPVNIEWPRGIVQSHPPSFLGSYNGPDRFVKYPYRRTVYALVNAVTGDTKVIDLGPDTEVAEFIDVSPDARYVVYSKYVRPLSLRPEEVSPQTEKPPVRLFLKDLSTGADRPILEERTWPADSLGRGWITNIFSPDCTQFVLTVHYKRVIELGRRETEPERWEIHLVNIEQDSAIKATEVVIPHSMRGTRWSPDGGHLAVLSQRLLGNDPITGRDIYRSELSVYRRDGSGASTWLVDGLPRMAFEWLSGDELVYADGKEVYRIKADGTGKKKVFPP